MTPLRTSIAATAVSVLLLLVVFELIRSRRLRERYALLWIATGVVLIALSAWRGGLNTIARWVGVRTYPPAVLFAVGLMFVILVLLHYSTVLSRLSDQNTVLAQRLALMQQRLEQQERGHGATRITDPVREPAAALAGGDADPADVNRAEELAGASDAELVSERIAHHFDDVFGYPEPGIAAA